MVVLLFSTSLMATPVTSVRPFPRPTDKPVPFRIDPGAPVLTTRTIRPGLRPGYLKDRQPLRTAQIVPTLQGFQAWIIGFRTRAQQQGIRSDVLDRAFAGVEYDADVIQRDRNQSEFSKSVWDYLDSAVSDTRIRNGRAALDRYASVLTRIEKHYGVEKEVVVAVWGLESAYGNFRGKNDIIQSLATLAYDGRRGAFFESQLIAALKILQSGDTNPRNMIGSWAGAMGHTQFIPTSYLDYAVDFNGDGRRDIWSDDPTDALASTAAYLRRFGWQSGQPWGVEITLPQGFDYALADRKITRSPDSWARLGIRDITGHPVPNHGTAAILLPAGAHGPAFMIFDNFAVIERYNAADAYVIGIGHLSDRLAGGRPFRASWPRSERILSFDERKELQTRLSIAGFDTRGIDGRIGPKTIDAVRRYQLANGLVPDGYPSLRLLKRLR
ncbi:MAG: lytic murein transglycosylase [Rhodobacteraceae bacterium]|nr:lytic murein transglycosylase [Paracoccaceae bacterium]